MALLEVSHLTKRFGGLAANNDISLRVDRGQIVGIIGPNGSGKSTFFNCISGVLDVTAGGVVLDGREITGLAPHRICRLGLARTFQMADVFTRMSALENVMVGAFRRDKRLGPARAMAREVLQQVGLAPKAMDPSHQLSPPERRRLSFAMALVTGPKLLMLDEAMAGLLPGEIDELLELIRTIKRQGIAVVVIEHVMDAVMSIADEIAVLEAGRLIASGPPEAIAADDRVIAAYLGEDYRRAHA